MILSRPLRQALMPTDPRLVYDPGDGGGEITLDLDSSTAWNRAQYPPGAAPSSSLDLGVWFAAQLSSGMGSPGAFTWETFLDAGVYKGKLVRNYSTSSALKLKFDDGDTTLDASLFGFVPGVEAFTEGLSLTPPHALWGCWTWPQAYLWRRRPERQVSLSEPQEGGSVIRTGATRYVYDFAFEGVEGPRLFQWDCDNVASTVDGLTSGDLNFSFEKAIWSDPENLYFHPSLSSGSRVAVALLGREFLGNLNTAVEWYGGSHIVPVAQSFAFQAVER